MHWKIDMLIGIQYTEEIRSKWPACYGIAAYRGGRRVEYDEKSLYKIDCSQSAVVTKDNIDSLETMYLF